MHISLTVPVLALTVPVSAGADAPPQLSPDHAVLIAEAERLRGAVGDAVWPGLGELDVPIVLQVGEHDWLFGYDEPVDGFEVVPAPPPLEGEIQVGPRRFEQDFAASFPVYGKPAVIIAPPEAFNVAPAEWVITVVHEAFHVLQMHSGEFGKVAALEIGPTDDASWQLNFPFPYSDQTVRNLIHQQAWPCYVGAERLDDAEARYAAGVAVEAASSLAAHLEASGAPPKSAEYAAFQAWKEGVARWVEWRAADAAAEHGYQSSPEFLALAGAQPLNELADQYAGHGFLAKHAGRASMSRTMFYHLGLAKAMLLERLDPTWKERYFEPGVWMDDLLDQASKAECAPPEG